jgi:hypothetical protein
MQIIYTRAGNLAQQFLMLCIDGATLKGDFLVVESAGPHATLPECIELLRMMHEQVSTATLRVNLTGCAVSEVFRQDRAGNNTGFGPWLQSSVLYRFS